MLAPSRETFALKDAPDVYTRAYLAGLEEIGPEKIRGELERISAEEGGKLLVCLCWEKSGEFCHRRIWADWYRQKTGQ